MSLIIMLFVVFMLAAMWICYLPGPNMYAKGRAARLQARREHIRAFLYRNSWTVKDCWSMDRCNMPTVDAGFVSEQMTATREPAVFINYEEDKVA